MLAVRANGTEGTTELTTASALFIYGSHVTFSDITDQRTLPERVDTAIDDAPGTLTVLLNRRKAVSHRRTFFTFVSNFTSWPKTF
jgi:hypothetical protein